MRAEIARRAREELRELEEQQREEKEKYDLKLNEAFEKDKARFEEMQKNTSDKAVKAREVDAMIESELIRHDQKYSKRIELKEKALKEVTDAQAMRGDKV